MPGSSKIMQKMCLLRRFLWLKDSTQDVPHFGTKSRNPKASQVQGIDGCTTPSWEIPDYKPYIVGIYGLFHPQESPRLNTTNTMGTHALGAHPIGVSHRILEVEIHAIYSH